MSLPNDRDERLERLAAEYAGSCRERYGVTIDCDSFADEIENAVRTGYRARDEDVRELVDVATEIAYCGADVEYLVRPRLIAALARFRGESK